MAKLITTRGVVFATPVLGDDGKPATTKIKHNGRDVTIPLVDHHRYDADQVIEVSASTARELYAADAVRKYDPVLDGGEDNPVAGENISGSDDPLA